MQVLIRKADGSIHYKAPDITLPFSANVPCGGIFMVNVTLDANSSLVITDAQGRVLVPSTPFPLNSQTVFNYNGSAYSVSNPATAPPVVSDEYSEEIRDSPKGHPKGKWGQVKWGQFSWA